MESGHLYKITFNTNRTLIYFIVDRIFLIEVTSAVEIQVT